MDAIVPPTALLFGGASVVAQLFLAGLFAHVLPHGPWQAQPGYTAHQLISFASMLYVTAVGCGAWFFPDEVLRSAASTTGSGS